MASRSSAESVQYLTRGRHVSVEGRPQTRTWDDAAPGQKRYRTEIVSEHMVLLDARRDRAGAPAAADVAEGAEPATVPV